MNIAQVIITGYTFDDAKKKIQSQFSCNELRRVPIPMAQNDRYYVCNENGQVFFMKQYSDGVCVTHLRPEMTRAKKPTYFYRISLGHGLQKQFNAPLLVWNTFSGEWHDEITVTCKDGNNSNICLSNLQCEQMRLASFEAPDFFGTIYEQYFKDYVHYLGRLCYDINKDDARDIVANAFIEIMTRVNDAEHLRLLWKLTVRKRLYDYIGRQQRHVEFDTEWMTPTYQQYPEIDFTQFLNRPTEIEVVRMIHSGYSIQDICEIQNRKRTTVSSHLSRAVQKIRQAI